MVRLLGADLRRDDQRLEEGTDAGRRNPVSEVRLRVREDRQAIPRVAHPCKRPGHLLGHVAPQVVAGMCLLELPRRAMQRIVVE